MTVQGSTSQATHHTRYAPDSRRATRRRASVRPPTRAPQHCWACRPGDLRGTTRTCRCRRSTLWPSCSTPSPQAATRFQRITAASSRRRRRRPRRRRWPLRWNLCPLRRCLLLLPRPPAPLLCLLRRRCWCAARPPPCSISTSEWSRCPQSLPPPFLPTPFRSAHTKRAPLPKNPRNAKRRFELGFPPGPSESRPSPRCGSLHHLTTPLPALPGPGHLLPAALAAPGGGGA